MRCWKCGNEISDNSQVCGEKINSSLENELLKGPVLRVQQTHTQMNEIKKNKIEPQNLPATVQNNIINPTPLPLQPHKQDVKELNNNQEVNIKNSIKQTSNMQNNEPPVNNNTLTKSYTDEYKPQNKGDGKTFGIFLLIIIALFAGHFFLTNNSNNEEKKELIGTVTKNKNENEIACTKTNEKVIIKYENEKVLRISSEVKIEKEVEDITKKMYNELNDEYGGVIYYVKEDEDILDLTFDFENFKIKDYLNNKDNKIEIINYSNENDIIKKDKVLEYYKNKEFNCE
ncbi:MAG: hypothetical protein IJ568_00205 [Bacilli bacterium]|nr:hypothetical protein [Bacilli bacterium]